MMKTGTRRPVRAHRPAPVRDHSAVTVQSAFPAAPFHEAFSRWLRGAQARDFIQLLHDLCGPGWTPGRRVERRGASPAPGRWVQRDGCTVRFTHGAVPGQARIHVHRLPTPRIAELFALALLRTSHTGGAAPLDPEEWAGWQHEQGGQVSTPAAMPVAVPLSGRLNG